jgi:CRISPR-associated protein Csm4
MEETSERVRSDTLFSALVISYARLGKNVDTLLQRFHQETLPFRLSSSFIYREQDSETTYFLPRPKQPPINYPIGNDLKIAKDYKKLNFLDLETWKSWYQNGGFNKDAKLPENSYGKCFDIDKQPKIAIDRNTRATNLYHTSFVHYRSKPNDKSGLYFLIKFHDEILENDLNDLKAALELLGEDGIGGERSSGAGQFEPSWHDLDEQWQKLIKFKGNSQSLISLYWDDDNLISLENSSYELQERGGWITSSSKNQRRKKVIMFAEGSVFREVPRGKLANVTPPEFSQHQIYRSGIAVSLPIKIN